MVDEITLPRSEGQREAEQRCLENLSAAVDRLDATAADAMPALASIDRRPEQAL